jgi:hypothetical protein
MVSGGDGQAQQEEGVMTEQIDVIVGNEEEANRVARVLKEALPEYLIRIRWCDARGEQELWVGWEEQ